MSRLQALYELMKVVAKKTGTELNEMFYKIDDLSVKAAEERSPVDARTAEKRIREAKHYFTYIQKGIDETVNQHFNKFRADMDSIAGDQKKAEYLASKINKKFQTGITADDFTKTDKKKYEEVIKDSIEKSILSKTSADWMAELHGYGGRDRIAEVVSGALGWKMADVKKAMDNGNIDAIINGMTLKEAKSLNQNVATALMAARRVAGKTLDDVNKFTTLDVISGNLSSRVSKLAEVFERNGNAEGANACKMLHAAIRNAAPTETAVRKAFANLESFKNAPLEKQNAIRTYIEEKSLKNLEKPVMMKGKDGVGKFVEADLELAGKLGLNDDEIQLANLVNNYNRMLLKGETGRLKAVASKDLDDNTQEFVSALDHLPDDRVLLKDVDLSNPVFSDYGHGFFHISITEKHRDDVKSAIEKSHPGYYDFTDYASTQAAYQKSRRTGSVAGLNENRKDPYTELAEYTDAYINSNTKKMLKSHLDNIGRHAARFDLMNRSSKLENKDYYNAYKYLIKDINTYIDDIFARQTTPSNNITKGIAGLTDLNTAAGIGSNVTSLANLATGDVEGFLQGQRMGVFNFLEFIPSTMAMKGIIPTLAAFKDSPSFAKAYLASIKSNGGFKKMTSPANMEIALDNVKMKIKDPDVRKAWTDYWKYEDPDILMHTYYDMDSNVQKIMNAVTTIFKGADIAARNVTIAASATFAKKAWLIGEKEILAGSPKAKDKLIKDLHLFEFDKLDRDYILEASGNMSEFVSRYARISTRYELFNYSRYYRPELINKAGRHWATARAARFLSWNMYYLNFLRGVVRAYNNGDKEPLKRLGMMSIVWFGTMSGLQRIDDNTVNAFASYGIGRTPLIGPVAGLAGITYRELTGIAAPSFATAAAAFIYTGDALNDLLSGEDVTGPFTRPKPTKMKADSLDFLWEKTYDSVRRQPVLKPLVNAYDNLFGEDKK